MNDTISLDNSKKPNRNFLITSSNLKVAPKSTKKIELAAVFKSIFVAAANNFINSNMCVYIIFIYFFKLTSFVVALLHGLVSTLASARTFLIYKLIVRSCAYPATSPSQVLILAGALKR